MKKRIITLALIIVMVFSLMGCGNKVSLKDQVDDYEFSGIVDNTAYWSVYFNEDCDTQDYSYKDFIEIVEKCMGMSKNYSAVYVSVKGFDPDGIARFSWDQHDGYTIQEADGNPPNIRYYEWNLTADEYNGIRNARD